MKKIIVLLSFLILTGCFNSESKSEPKIEPNEIIKEDEKSDQEENLEETNKNIDVKQYTMSEIHNNMNKLTGYKFTSKTTILLDGVTSTMNFYGSVDVASERAVYVFTDVRGAFLEIFGGTSPVYFGQIGISWRDGNHQMTLIVDGVKKVLKLEDGSLFESVFLDERMQALTIEKCPGFIETRCTFDIPLASSPTKAEMEKIGADLQRVGLEVKGGFAVKAATAIYSGDKVISQSVTEFSDFNRVSITDIN